MKEFLWFMSLLQQRIPKLEPKNSLCEMKLQIYIISI